MEWEPILSLQTELKILGSGQQFVKQMSQVSALVLQIVTIVVIVLRCTLQLITILKKSTKLAMQFDLGLQNYGVQKFRLNVLRSFNDVSDVTNYKNI